MTTFVRLLVSDGREREFLVAIQPDLVFLNSKILWPGQDYTWVDNPDQTWTLTLQFEAIYKDEIMCVQIKGDRDVD